jgi:D-alanyl-D-alanine carboxypeptidase/D-alanyl-D-alanine-endopeptidase (penicillin-binding protein 4)
VQAGVFDQVIQRFSARRPRIAGLLVLAAIACWGEPGARGAATPQSVAGPAAPPAEADEPDPVPASARPPEPQPDPVPAPARPPEPRAARSWAPSVARPAPAPAAIGERARPKLSALSRWVEQRGGELGVAVRDLGSGRELLASGAERALNPASNQKLVTAAVALSTLGPEFRFRVAVLGKIDSGVAARLVLRSNGDPSLTQADLDRFVEELFALGLRHISGDILVDQSAFDDQYSPPGFEQQPGEWAAFRAPVSAVALERNTTTLQVVPGAAGELAMVGFEPPGYVAHQGSVRTLAGKKREYIGLTLTPLGERLAARVSGHVPPGHSPYRITRRIDNPALYAGLVLEHLLVAKGIQHDGGVVLGGADEAQELVGRDSETVASLAKELGKASDNFYAEMLFKAAGARAYGAPASADKATRLALAWLAARQIDSAGQAFGNGSGLYGANSASARLLTRVLEAAYLDPSISEAFRAQLALGGIDGTLRQRFAAHRQRRSILAKTGTLSRVVSLSGYVLGPAHETGLAFSILVSGIAGQHGEARRLIDELVSEMSDVLWERSRALARH